MKGTEGIHHNVSHNVLYVIGKEAGREPGGRDVLDYYAEAELLLLLEAGASKH